MIPEYLILFELQLQSNGIHENSWEISQNFYLICHVQVVSDTSCFSFIVIRLYLSQVLPNCFSSLIHKPILCICVGFPMAILEI